MNKEMKVVHNVLQFVFCNSSGCHYLAPLRKGVILKMAYLAEFWLILESDLVERAPHKIFFQWILESIIKRIYPPLNSDLLFFTFPLKFSLDILWLPQSPIGIQYAQV
jgi:hypothetical protein